MYLAEKWPDFNAKNQDGIMKRIHAQEEDNSHHEAHFKERAQMLLATVSNSSTKQYLVLTGKSQDGDLATCLQLNRALKICLVKSSKTWLEIQQMDYHKNHSPAPTLQMPRQLVSPRYKHCHKMEVKLPRESWPGHSYMKPNTMGISKISE